MECVFIKYDIIGVIDNRSEKIGCKIWDIEVKKILFMLIIGEKEVVFNMVFVRR